MTSRIEKEYEDALQRLVDRYDLISLNRVAKEAGKQPGSLRKQRYPDVCVKVERAIFEQEASQNKKPSKKAPEEIYQELKDLNSSLVERNALLSARVVSLENQLFEVTKELEQSTKEKTDKSAKKVSSIKAHL